MHKVLELHWSGKDAAQYLKDSAENISPDDAARVAAMFANYEPPLDSFDVLGVEVPFTTKIKNPRGGRSFRGYRLAGKIDLLLQEKVSGEKIVLDHKTTSCDIEGFSDYWKALQVDGQMANYCMAVGARTFIYDVLKKPTIKMCGKDAKEAEKNETSVMAEYGVRCSAWLNENRAAAYQWRSFTKTDDDLNDAGRDLWAWLEMFRACSNSGRYPRNSDACVSRYGTCPYVGVCTGRADIGDDSIFRTKAGEHEELI